MPEAQVTWRGHIPQSLGATTPGDRNLDLGTYYGIVPHKVSLGQVW